MADDDSAEPLFQAAMDATANRWPLYRARLELLYGSWLRRQRRVAESRPPLRAAREAFDALGAVPWSERARQELRASGEASRHRVAASWDQLSPQELQIVHMAAEGLSNREIGQRLFLSPSDGRFPSLSGLPEARRHIPWPTPRGTPSRIAGTSLMLEARIRVIRTRGSHARSRSAITRPSALIDADLRPGSE